MQGYLSAGPRRTAAHRPDHGSEIIRCVATIALAGTKSTLFAGLSAEARDAIINKLPQNHAKVVGLGDVAALSVDPNPAERPGSFGDGIASASAC
jgi:hypothetical protein